MELRTAFSYAEYLKTVYDLAKDWQTLIAGILAIYGGLATLKAARTQSNTTLEVENNRRAAEAYAARAVMPLALSAISSYADKCIHVLASTMEESSSTEARQLLGDLPSLSSELIDQFKSTIIFSDNPIKKDLADLVSFYQVQDARLRGLKARSLPTNPRRLETAQAIVDAADLKSKADRLFDWARREEEGEFPLATAKEIRTSLLVSMPTHSFADEVLILIERRSKRDSAS